jgi:hypothetical protein
MGDCLPTHTPHGHVLATCGPDFPSRGYTFGQGILKLPHTLCRSKTHTGFGPICLSCRYGATLRSNTCALIGDALARPISNPAEQTVLPAL